MKLPYYILVLRFTAQGLFERQLKLKDDVFLILDHAQKAGLTAASEPGK